MRAKSEALTSFRAPRALEVFISFYFILLLFSLTRLGMGMGVGVYPPSHHSINRGPHVFKTPHAGWAAAERQERPDSGISGQRGNGTTGQQDRLASQFFPY